MIEVPPEIPTMQGSDDDYDPTRLPLHPPFKRLTSVEDKNWKLSGFGYVYKEPIVKGASKPKIMVN